MATTTSATLKRKASSDTIEGDSPDKRQDTGGPHELLVVDPDGDLKMVLDSGTLQVSRKALTLSSPVFLAMLGKNGKFLEATNQTFGQAGFQTIAFPEDDLETTATITRIIHLQFDVVPTELPFQKLVKIAKHCDKYDLKRCLGPYPDMWCKPYLHSYALEGYEDWLNTSTVFRNDVVFTEVTRHFILNTTVQDDNRLITPGGYDISERSLPSIIDQIWDVRAAAMVDVLNLYWKEAKRLRESDTSRVCKVGGRHVAQCDAINLGCLLQKLPELTEAEEEDFYSRRSIDQVSKIPNGMIDVCGALHFKFGDHRQCAIGLRLAAASKQIMERVKGLDLNNYVP